MVANSMLSTGFLHRRLVPSRWSKIWANFGGSSLIYFLVVMVTVSQVNCDEGSNRVLPVDQEHQIKISKPLDPICAQIIRDNLVRFLKRYPPRQARQDDGDDDGDGDEGIAGVIGNLAEGNGALSTFAMLPSVLPQLVMTFTQLSGAVNQGLNGTDTPNIPSFLIRQGQEAVKFFQALSGAAQSSNNMASRVPETVHVQRIPGSEAVPTRRPRPPGANFEAYPGTVSGGPVDQLTPGLDIEDYLDEDVKQYLRPTLAPLLSSGGGQGGYNPQYPYLQNNNIYQRPFGGGLNNVDPNVETLNGLPPRTSLWQIYKSFQQRPGENGSLTDFQLAHPEAFSNELLQSISHAITNIRGHMSQVASQQEQSPQDIHAEKPNSEVLKEIFNSTTEQPSSNPNPPKPAPLNIFNGLKRPTLSVYKPSGGISGVGIDLSNLALNRSHTLLKERPNIQKEQEPAASSGEDTTSSQPSPQGELDVPPGVELGRPLKAGSTFIGTGSLENLKQQNQQHTMSTSNNGGSQFVDSSGMSHHSQPGYMPVVNNLHQAEDSHQQVGPQLPAGDQNNGFNNKAPYTPVLNGILLEAPRLPSPPPSVYQKRPSNLIINTDEKVNVNEQVDPTRNSPPPEFAFQAKDKPKLPSNFHGPDPTTRRSPTLVAAIPNKFDYEQQQRPIQEQSGVAPQNLFAKPTDAVPESDVEKFTQAPITALPAVQEGEEGASLEEDVQSSNPIPTTVQPPAPPPPPPSPPQAPPPPQQVQANKLLQQLLFLQRVLQRQQQNRLQQNFNLVQNAVDRVVNSATVPTTTTTTTTLPPPPPPPQDPLPEEEEELKEAYTSTLAPQAPITVPTKAFASAPGYAIPGLSSPISPGGSPAKYGSSSIANGFANALINNNFPPGSSLLVPNKLGINNKNKPAQTTPTPLPTPPSTTSQPTQTSASNTGSIFSGTLLQAPSFAIEPSLATVPGVGPPIIGVFANSNGGDNTNVFGAPIRTTTKAPIPTTTKAPPTSKPAVTDTNNNPIRIEQFPTFANNGPSSYFPQASSSLDTDPQKDTQGATISSPSTQQQLSGNSLDPAPAVVQSSSPLLSSAFHGNQAINAQNIPETTTKPIAGAFSPYQPFGTFPIRIGGSGPVQPPSASGAEAAALNSQEESQSAFVSITTPATTKSLSSTSASITTELAPLSSFNFIHPSGSFFPAGVPVSSPGELSSGTSGQSSGVPAFPPPAPPRLPQPPKNTQDPYQFLTRPHFQRPAQSGGYPQYVPSTPILVTASGLKTPTNSAAYSHPGAPLPNPVNTAYVQQNVSLANSTITTLTPTLSSSPPPFTDSAEELISNFAQNKLSFSASLHNKKVSSAIAAMGHLPYYQQDTFLPSALPPHFFSTSTPTSVSQNPEDSSFEELAAESVRTEKPFKELFSSSANVSVDTSPTTTTPTSPAAEESLSGSVPNYGAAEENDSAEEQPYPNFPPGKPVYWMNMYYPSGVPVLVKVTSTAPPPTSPKPRRRRTRSTTTHVPTTTAIPEVEYYDVEEEDADGVKKAKKKPKIIKNPTD